MPSFVAVMIGFSLLSSIGVLDSLEVEEPLSKLVVNGIVLTGEFFPLLLSKKILEKLNDKFHGYLDLIG